jgi:cardiolipin synthase
MSGDTIFGLETEEVLKSNLPVTAMQGNLRIVQSGTEYFDLLASLCDGATETIYLQTYIFDDDNTGRQVAHHLRAAAGRGVKVHVLVDGYASQDLSPGFVKTLREVGIHFRFFDPIWKSKHFYFGRRLHHKVTVVDGNYALVGGINISDRYNDTPESPAWLDYAIYMEGQPAKYLQKICAYRAIPGSIMRKSVVYPTFVGTSGTIRIRVNDWVRGKREVTKSYLRMLRNAEQRVTLLSSYFLPGREFRRHLAMAARRGTKIRLIVAGISDVKTAKYAERFMYRWLLTQGIEIYEYQRQVLHGKVGVADGAVLSIGSYNINNISARASIELNMEVHDLALARSTEQLLQKIIDHDCLRITWTRYVHMTTFGQRVLQRVSYGVFRTILFLFTFYFRQRE